MTYFAFCHLVKTFSGENTKRCQLQNRNLFPTDCGEKDAFGEPCPAGDKVTKPNFVESKYGGGVLLAFGWGGFAW